MKHHLIQKFKKAASILAIIATVASAATFAYAQTPLPTNLLVTGNLWSDMPDGSDQIKATTNASAGRGLGWIQLQQAIPTTTGLKLASGVTFNIQTGSFSGSGWYEHDNSGGWLDFKPSGPYPSGTGTVGKSAYIDPACLGSTATTCGVQGWARFMVTGGSPGGWDGWVSMQGGIPTVGAGGLTMPYGVTLNKSTQMFSGHAWGDKVSGWIDFSRAKLDVKLPPLECKGSDGKMYPYQAGQALPLLCQTGNICYDTTVTPQVKYDYAVGESVPSQCTQLLCYNVTTKGEVRYQVGTTMPSVCDRNVRFCTDKNAENYGDVAPCEYSPTGGDTCDDPDAYNYGSAGECSYDFCPLIPGKQDRGSGPWKVDGVWYGSAGDHCIKSYCPNLTDQFYANLPDNTYTKVNGICEKTDDYCQRNPLLCQGGKVKPVYIEN